MRRKMLPSKFDQQRVTASVTGVSLTEKTPSRERPRYSPYTGAEDAHLDRSAQRLENGSRRRAISVQSSRPRDFSSQSRESSTEGMSQVQWRESASEQRLRVKRELASQARQLREVEIWTKKQMLSNYVGQPMSKHELQFAKNYRVNKPKDKGEVKPCQLRNLIINQKQRGRHQESPTTLSSHKMISFADQQQQRSRQHGLSGPHETNESLYATNQSDKQRENKRKAVAYGSVSDLYTSSCRSIGYGGPTTPMMSVRSRGGHRHNHRGLSIIKKRGKQQRQLDGKAIVKAANMYFQNHPTCLKRDTNSSSSSRSSGTKGRGSGGVSQSYARLLIDSASSSSAEKRPKYPIKNPFYEDKDSYNLEACIRDKRKPVFGYAVPSIWEGSDKPELHGVQSSKSSGRGIDMEMLKPCVIALKREKQFMEHVLKCFTFGKPVRRNEPLVSDETSRVEEIKSKFNRVRLIRRYFSIKRRNLNRKFDFPIDQLGRLVRGKKRPDYQQYCIESDFEHEYPRRTRREQLVLAQEVGHLKHLHFGVTNPAPQIKQPVFTAQQPYQDRTDEATQQTPTLEKQEAFDGQIITSQSSKRGSIPSGLQGGDEKRDGEKETDKDGKTPNFHQEYGEPSKVSDRNKRSLASLKDLRRKSIRGSAMISPSVNLFKRVIGESHEFCVTSEVQSETESVQQADQKQGGLQSHLSQSDRLQGLDLSRAGRTQRSSQRESYQKSLDAQQRPGLKSKRAKDSKAYSETEDNNAASTSFDNERAFSRLKKQVAKSRARKLSQLKKRALVRQTQESKNKQNGDDDLQSAFRYESTATQDNYFEGQEFEQLKSEVDRSYCSSIADQHEQDLLGKDHQFQPYDFSTFRKTKRFFREDFLNLTRASTNKAYAMREFRKDVDRTLPRAYEALDAAEHAFQDYLQKQYSDSLSPKAENQSSDDQLPEGGRYAGVRPYSPTWRALRKRHKFPEQITLEIERSATNEIPELSRAYRLANQIPLKYEVNKAKIKRDYRQFMGKKTTESSDSEYEQKNLLKQLKSKRDKGVTSLSVLHQVESRLKKKQAQANSQYGQRSQHIQIRDSSNRLEEVHFLRSQHQTGLQEKRQRLQKLQLFKQGLTEDQIQILKDRQFVIVDQAKLLGRQRPQHFNQNKKPVANSALSEIKSIATSMEKKSISRSMNSLEGTQQTKVASSIQSLEKTKSAAAQKQIMDKRESMENAEVKQTLYSQSKQLLEQNALKNAEFNRDVRRQFNRYKRQARERQVQKEQEDERLAQMKQEQDQLLREYQQDWMSIPEEENDQKDFSEALQQAVSTQGGEETNSPETSQTLAGLAPNQSRDTIMTSEFAYGATQTQSKATLPQKDAPTLVKGAVKSMQHFFTSSQLKVPKPTKGDVSIHKATSATDLGAAPNTDLAGRAQTSAERLDASEDLMQKSIVRDLREQRDKSMSYVANATIQDAAIDQRLLKLNSRSHTAFFEGQELSRGQNSSCADISINIAVSKSGSERTGQNTARRAKDTQMQSEPDLRIMISSGLQQAASFKIDLQEKNSSAALAQSKRLQEKLKHSSTYHVDRMPVEYSGQAPLRTRSDFCSPQKSVQSVKSTATSHSNDAYRHIPSERLSPVGDLIEDALRNVPKIPDNFDKRNPKVLGMNADKPKTKGGSAKTDGRKNSYFSKFMLDRLKKQSILNHEVFKHDGVDYKKQVARNYQRFQRIVLNDLGKKQDVS